LFESGPLFDFYTAAHPDVPVSAEAMIVPEMLVREVLDKSNFGLKWLLGQLSGIPHCKAIVVGTPPPKGNDQRLRSLLCKEPVFVDAARSLGLKLDEVELTKPQVRRKLWLVTQDLFREAAEMARFEFIPVPTEAMDESGFLREDLWEEDATHANGDYGNLFWKVLLPSGRSAQ
jgi:hypothetical protein